MPVESDTIVRILGTRPTHLPEPHPVPIPAEATIYNGPEMLWGTFVDGMSLSWAGEPIDASGSRYAAILPDDPDAVEWRARNFALGAVVLEYVTIAQVRQALVDFYAGTEGLDSTVLETMLRGASDRQLWARYVDAALHIDRVPVL